MIIFSSFSPTLLIHVQFVRNKPIGPIKGEMRRLGAQWREVLIKVLARAGVWCTGTLGAVTADNLVSTMQVPHWLSTTEVTALPGNRLGPCEAKSRLTGTNVHSLRWHGDVQSLLPLCFSACSLQSPGKQAWEMERGRRTRKWSV